MYHYKESELQMRCVTWFAYQYPHLRMLLYHPKNEGTANGRRQGAIAKAEGVVAGVADLMLQVPALGYHCLAIEMKTKTGRQSPEQKLFQLYLENAGGKYVVCRSYDDFVNIVSVYLAGIDLRIEDNLKSVYAGQKQAEDDLAKKRLQSIINKK